MKKLLLLILALTVFPPLQAAVSAGKINDMLGIPLLPDTAAPWEIDPLRQRTRLPLRGNPGRYSAKPGRNIAGVPAEELVVYTAKNGKSINRISIIYANKGDTAGKYKNKIKDASLALEAKITAAAGAKRRTQFISGKYKNKADVWQFTGGRIYLEVNKKEFAMLHIIPDRTVRQSAVRQNFQKNVRHNKFGDVYIDNIPMVDQGAKGYCVPATMERIFLYNGIHLDMHHLAEIGNTKRGGGTSMEKMLRDISSLRRKSGLKSTRFSAVSVNTVSGYIDEGIPVMWVMFSTRELQMLYSFSKQNRSKASSPQEWLKKIRKINIPKKEDGPHICLIIGYNKLTDEIAVSNSWGQAHIAPLWIPVKAAKKVTQKCLMVFKQ